jgi:hypothetical protein
MARILSLFSIILMVLSSADAFMTPSSMTPLTSSSNSCHRSLTTTTTQTPIATKTTSTTALFERQWNFNQGRGPWGLKKNAEIWNGRVAQVAFVVVLLQELITGKGVIASITDGDAVGYAFLGLAGVGTLGLTIWLAIKGDESDIVF